MHPRVFGYFCSENIINMKICQRSPIHLSSTYISAISKTCRGTGQQFTTVELSISSFYPAHSNRHLSKQWVRGGSSVWFTMYLVINGLHQDPNEKWHCAHQQHTTPSNGTSATTQHPWITLDKTKTVKKKKKSREMWLRIKISEGVPAPEQGKLGSIALRSGQCGPSD